MQNPNRTILLAIAPINPSSWLWLIQAPSRAKRTLGILLVVSVTGCGGGGGGNTGSGETSPTNPESQSAMKGVTIRSLAPVNLASTAAYAIFSSATIVHAPSRITGDVGVRQANEVSVVNCEEVTGTIHSPALAPLTCGLVDDSSLAVGQADLSHAYEDAASRSVGSLPLAAEISGQRLAPGLYQSASSLEITSADVVLDAQGDGSAVWIFKIPSMLHIGAGRQVILRNGARASNIYWQVGHSATLGEAATFKGTILANDSITLLAGASLEGRALARTGNVSLSANIITRPAP